MRVNQPVAVVFLDRNRLGVYGKNLVSPLSVELPETIVSDLSVVDRAAAVNLIGQWLANIKIQPSDFVVICADAVCFSKQLTAADSAGLKTEAAAFFEEVPFEDVLSKVYTVSAHAVAVATNRGFLNTIFDPFITAGWTLRAVVPLFLLGDHRGKRWLDESLGRYVIDTIEALENFSLFSIQEYAKGNTGSLPSQSAWPKRLFVLVGILVILVVFLLLLLK